MKLFKGDLVLEKDTTFNESIKVEGDIRGKDGERFDLKVKGDIDAGNINAGNINAGNITAGNIDAVNINAWNIHAGDIDAVNINAGNINAGNITAGNIDAGNITAGNINAWNITARDIYYYAFCIAYDSIKCISIKGRRDNSFHKALDGKITIESSKGGIQNDQRRKNIENNNHNQRRRGDCCIYTKNSR